MQTFRPGQVKGMRDAVDTVSASEAKFVVLSFMLDESTFRLYPSGEAPQAGLGSVLCLFAVSSFRAWLLIEVHAPCWSMSFHSCLCWVADLRAVPSFLMSLLRVERARLIASSQPANQ